jgi:hypothetical protein
MVKMLGRANHGFVDISAIALNAAISGSILADPDACFVMMILAGAPGAYWFPAAICRKPDRHSGGLAE